MATCNHNHAPGETHDHDHAAVSSTKLAWAVALTLAFVVIEFIAGTFSHSLALMSDAGHNLTDAAALGFSWYALWIAKKPAGRSMTFGYHRVGIFAALVNASSLVLIALGILVEGIVRLIHPEPSQGLVMIGVAAIAVVLNLTIGGWMHGHSHSDLNVRSAYLHMIGDAVSAAGVVLAGILVAITHWQWIDPLVSLLIAGLILASSWGILRDSVKILLEGTPSGVDMKAVEQNVAAVDGVLGVHDLHVWTVGPGLIAASLHILVAEQPMADGQTVVAAVTDRLRTSHQINHATVQMEVQCCRNDAMYCCAQPMGQAG